MSSTTPSESLHLYIADRLADLGGDMHSPYLPMRVAENLLFYLQHKYGPITNPSSLHFPSTCERDGEGIATEVTISVAYFGSKLEVPITITASSAEGVVEKLNDRIEELIKPLLK